MYIKKYLDNNNLLISMKSKKIKISSDKEVLKFLEQVNYSKLKEYLYYFDKDNKNFNNKNFKEIIDLYNFLKIKDKKKIANLIDKNLDFKVLNSWLANILTLRNFCSHNNRIWNRNFKPLANITNNINSRTTFAEIYIIYKLLKILRRENEIRRLRKECRKFFRKYPDLMKSFGINNLKDLNLSKF